MIGTLIGNDEAIKTIDFKFSDRDIIPSQELLFLEVKQL